nr:hypothetical protein [uncultured Acetatifactor sp.]
MISEERVFAQSLEKVRRLAGEQGNCISEEQVREEFAALDLSDAQLQMVYDYLKKHGVGIGEPPDSDSFLTEEERNYLQEYLDEIAKIPVCGGVERESCILSAMAGDAQARRRLTESYLKEVADIARLYTGQGVPLEDLIGEGNVALSVAVGRLGEMQNAAGAQKMLVQFIMDAMETFIRENAENEKRDRHIADKVNRVADKARKLAGEYHRKVTPEELMRETGLSMKVIQDAVRMSGYKIEDIEYAEDGI